MKPGKEWAGFVRLNGGPRWLLKKHKNRLTRYRGGSCVAINGLGNSGLREYRWMVEGSPPRLEGRYLGSWETVVKKYDIIHGVQEVEVIQRTRARA